MPDGITITDITPRIVAKYKDMPADIVGRKSSDGSAFIRISGDSMEDTPRDGDMVLFGANQNTIYGGGIFVVDIGYRLAIKRLQSFATGEINIISDNSVKYPPETVAAEYVHISGKMI